MAVVAAFLGMAWLWAQRSEHAPAVAEPSQPVYPSTGIATDAPDTVFIQEDDEEDSDLAQRKEHAIAVAREYLKSREGRDVDATFTVKAIFSGEYRVFVEFIDGYDEKGNPLQIIDHNCTIEISKDWQVTEVIPGP